MFLNDRSVADIAAELGMAENSVHQAVSRCRRFLTERRKVLEELL
jgi:DNA-directed RNA polymerase specialized sigma24 family protein